MANANTRNNYDVPNQVASCNPDHFKSFHLLPYPVLYIWDKKKKKYNCLAEAWKLSPTAAPNDRPVHSQNRL